MDVKPLPTLLAWMMNPPQGRERENLTRRNEYMYQFQLPWYTVEMNAQKQEVDENRKKT